MKIPKKPPPTILGPTASGVQPAQQRAKRYMDLLRKLRGPGYLGKVVIYPAMGVDIFPALFTRVIGLNLWAYTFEKIKRHLAPILPDEAGPGFDRKLQENLDYRSRFDIHNYIEVRQILSSSAASASPRTVLLKGLFETAFKHKWDADTESYYELTPRSAKEKAGFWLQRIIPQLIAGDTVISFDRIFSSLLAGEPSLKEIKIGLKDQGADCDFVYKVHRTSIIYLPGFVRIFKK